VILVSICMFLFHIMNLDNQQHDPVVASHEKCLWTDSALENFSRNLDDNLSFSQNLDVYQSCP